MRAMTEREALEALAEAETIPVVQGPLAEVKRIWRACLEQDLPVVVAAPEGPACGGARLALLVRKEDASAVVALLQNEWKVDREGVDPAAAARLGVEAGEGEEPPCPACGTAAPLVEGACGECGLQLE
jgi:hypothetical protein